MLKNKYTNENFEFSCEVFPPKRDEDIYGIFKTVDDIASLDLDFISVTYGAGGSNSKKTAMIAAYIENIAEVQSLAHMTAVGMTPDRLKETLDVLNKKSVSRVLVLRGDCPRNMTREEFDQRYYQHASDMIPEIKADGRFEISAACYPECHPESKSLDDDIHFLKEKCDLGVNSLITQMFFDNEKFYQFMDRCEKAGIDLPVHAGIMPITNANMLGTSVSLSGSSVPHALSELLAKYAENPADIREAGIEYAVNQIDDLMRHGAYGVHLYSMNKAKATKEIYDAITK